MPITANPALYPSLTFEQANPFLAGAKYALGMGTDLSNIITQNLEQQKARAILPFAGPQAQANLSKTQLENQWYPALQQSLIKMQGSHSGLFDQEAALNKQNAIKQLMINNYIRSALAQGNDMGSTMQSIPGQQIQPAPMQQQPQQQMQQPVQPQQTGTGVINNSGTALGAFGAGAAGQHPLVNAIMGQQRSLNTPLSTPPGEMPLASEEQEELDNLGDYGVQRPDVQRSDVGDKIAFGIDKITPKLENHKQQVQEEYNNYVKNSVAASNKAKESTQQLQNLALYNKAMDEADQGLTGLPNLEIPGTGIPLNLQTGPLGGMMRPITPGAQKAANIVAQMSLPAISAVKEAAGGSKFSIPELLAAQSTKPGLNWTKPVRDDFTKRFTAKTARDVEEASFWNKASNPKMKLKNSDAQALLAAYESQYPLVDKQGNLIPENLGHVNDFLTPRAILSVKKNGTYNPITKENIEQTMRETNLTKQQVIKELKRLGRTIPSEVS